MASTIRIAILANAAKAKAEMGSVTSAAGRMSSALKVGVVGAAVGAGAALAAMAADGIAGARESAQIHRVLESQLAGMNAASRKAFGGATKFAEDYGKAIGKDDDDILKVINKLSTFPAAFGKGTVGAKGMERATKAAFDLQATGIGDAESNIVGIGKALDNPVKGLTALSKSGVSFTATQQAQIKNYMKHGQLAKAQAVLLTGIESNAKGAALAQADGLDRAKTALAGFAENLASKALPYLDQFGAWFTDVGLPKVEQFIAWFQANGVPKISEAFTMAKAAGQTFIDILSNPAVQAFGAAILAVVLAVKAYQGVMAVIRIATLAWTVAQAALNIVMMLNPIGLVVLAIIALAAGFYVAYQRSATFRAIVDKVWAALKRAGSAVADFARTAVKWIGELPGKISGFFSSAKTILLDAGRKVIDGLWNGLKEKWDSVVGWFGGITKSIPLHKGPPAKDATLLVRSGHLIMGGFLDGLRSKYGTVKGSLRKFTSTLAAEITAKAKARADATRQALADLVKARADYAKSTADAARVNVSSLFDGLNAVPSAKPDSLITAMQGRLAAVRAFSAGLAELKRKGLGTSVLQQLIDGGVDSGGAAVDALRKASPAILAQIHSLDAAIARESTTLGNKAGQIVFGDRVSAAQKAAAAPTVIELRSSGSKIDDLLLELVRKAIRVRGGNVQLVLGRG